MNLLLTDADRLRFAEWLEHEAATANSLVKHMEKLGVPSQLIARERAEAGAALLIARKLRMTESFTINEERKE